MDENNQGLQWSHIEPLCILRALARQLWMLLLAALTCAMAAWIVLTCFVTQQYTSSTTFSVTTRTSNLYYTNITAAADVAASYSQLLQSRVLRQTMEQDLGMPLNGTVTAQQLGETNLIRVTVTAGTPRQALVLLKAVSDNYGSLSAHVSSTAVLSQLNSPSLSVAPSRSYNVPRICLMAAIAGAALTALGVAWASVSSGTVQTQEGARSDLDAKIISTVPHEGRRTRKLLGWFDDRRRERRARRGGKRLRRNLNISSPAISFAFTESIHRIAEKFQHEHAKGRRVFLFSSVSAAEGKSTLAANTAISLASRGVNVLFIDLDLRRPVQSEMLGLSVKQAGHPADRVRRPGEDPGRRRHGPRHGAALPAEHQVLYRRHRAAGLGPAGQGGGPGPGAVRLCYHRLAAAGLLLRQRAAVGPVRRVGAGGAAGHRPRAGDQRRH